MKPLVKLFSIVMLCIAITKVSVAGPQEDLITACKQGNLDGAKTAVDAGAVINQLDAAGVTPLVYSVMWPDIVSYLLDKGADPNMGNNTALYNAVVFYSVDAVKLLLAKGADVNKGIITPGFDEAAIYRKLMEDEKAKGKSANKHMIKSYESLITAAKPPKAETRQSPLEYAVGNSNCVECVKLLLDAGAKTDGRDPMENGNLIYILASSAAEPKVRIDGWKTAMPVYETNYGFKFPDWFKNLDATRCGKAEDILMMLLTKGLNVNDSVTTFGYTPLGRALYYKKPSIANLLLQNGADPNIPCKYYVATAKMTNIQYPICMAAEQGTLETMKLMVEKGANINTVAKGSSLLTLTKLTAGDGYTPLVLAIMCGNIDIANYLIGQGADVNIGVQGSSVVRPNNIPDYLVSV